MKIVVHEWERVLRYRDGRLVEVLGAGRHRVRRRRTELVRLDLRPALVPVAGQEVLTADGLTVRLSLLVRLRVAEPRTWHEASAGPRDVVYAALQVAVREAVAGRTLEQLLAAREELAREVRTAALETAEQVGAGLDDVAVRDLVVPPELRRAAADLVAARAQSEAALERARGEVAAVRALANAARTAADNPAVLRLREIQAAESRGGTLVLHAP